MKTNENFYPSWKTKEKIMISDKNDAKDIDFKFFVASLDVGNFPNNVNFYIQMKKFKWEHCLQNFYQTPYWISVKQNHINRNLNLSEYFDDNFINHVIVYCDTFNDFQEPLIEVIRNTRPKEINNPI